MPPMPPQIPQRLYTGPVVPLTYDPSYQTFTNLTPAQIVAFESFPQALSFYLRDRRWKAEISGFTFHGIPLTTLDRDQAKVGQLKQGFDTGAITGTVPFFDAAGNVQIVDSATASAIYNAVVNFVQLTFSVAASLQTGIGNGTITTRLQIDQALAAVAPNSPSATNPSPT